MSSNWPRTRGNVPVAVVCLLVIQAVCAGAQGVEVGHQKQLFVDDYVVAEMDNVTRELGQVTKANGGEPVLVADKPWENADIIRMGSVFRDGNRFRMWYQMGGELFGYAESEDGIHWNKPALGFYEFEGNTNNNITDPMGFGCFLDGHETDPEHRYKSAYGHPKKIMACLAHSPDGFHWTAYNEGLPVTGRAADTSNQLLWDESAQVYRLFTRTDYGRGRFGGSLDENRGTRDMTNPDVKADPTAWTMVREWHFDRQGPWEFKRRQVYSLNGWPYEGVLFGLLWCYEWAGDMREGLYDLDKRHERDILNYYIVTARGDEMWDTQWIYAEKPLIPRGPDGSFDKDWAQPAPNIITWNDEHWIYYAGARERHDIYRFRPEGTRWQCAIGLARLRLDGFVSLSAGEEPGTILTKPFVLKGTRVEANVDAAQGEFTMEILDESGEPIPGYAGDDAISNRNVDDLRLNAEWADGHDLAPLKNKVIRLRFGLSNAKLYAFQILP